MRAPRGVFVSMFVTAAAMCAAAPSTDKELLDALRSGNSAAVKKLIAQGAPVNARDEFGSSALMYAGLYSDAPTVRLLLDKGADANHSDNAGATALMWSVSDLSKVRLLLDGGANVNAVSPLTGKTPLIIASGRPGMSAVARLLLDKGADPNAADKQGVGSIMAAAAAGDTDTLKLLLDRGVPPDPKSPGITPLGLAIRLGQRRTAEMLLSRGADPAKAVGGALVGEAVLSDVALFRKLIVNGADPKARTRLGQDVLIAAASIDVTDPEVVQELIKLGADPHLKIKNIHTGHGYGAEEGALDWAARHGDTPVARILAAFNKGVIPAEGVKTDELPRLKASTPRNAIEKALPLLYEGGREFFKRSGCTSCHHNMLPAVAFSMLRTRGVPVDEEKVRRNSQQSVAWLGGNQHTLLQDVRMPGGDYTTAYLLWGLAADGHARTRATDAAAINLAQTQTLEGSWRIVSFRPPLESSPVTPTAIAIRALRSYGLPHRRADFQLRIGRAAKWLAAFSPRTGEERVMRVLGLSWADTEAKALARAADELAAKQRPDGGWAQLDTLASDSYATGQALYALNTAGRLSKEALEKGTRFLLETQLADGSWYVRSRSYPVQPNYFDTGFPHGRDQWISAAGTTWACIGLTLNISR